MINLKFTKGDRIKNFVLPDNLSTVCPRNLVLDFFLEGVGEAQLNSLLGDLRESSSRLKELSKLLE